jgi:uncharacterized metal-binding protein YceD (DUF177 family)
VSEFSRTIRIDTLGETPRRLNLSADEGERAALAKRFGFVAIERLEAEAAVTRRNDAITATGTLGAALVQSCVATGAPVPEAVEVPFAVEFRPHPTVRSEEEEIELQGAELDVTFYEGGMVDIGEAVAETLSLSAEPYPRAPGAEDKLREAGVKNEEESGAFAALAALRDKLKQRP